MTDAVSIRIPEDKLEEIDRRARARRLTRTAFMIKAALSSRLPTTVEEQQLGEISERQDAFERETRLGLRGLERRLEMLELEKFGQSFSDTEIGDASS